MHTIKSFIKKMGTDHQVLCVDGWGQRCSLLLMAQKDLTTKGHKDLMSLDCYYQYITANQNILNNVIAQQSR